MATETIYVVQTFTIGARGALKAETPTSAKSEAGAVRTAERLAGSRAGVVAFASTGDAETGEFDDAPKILFRAGRLPAPFSDGD